MNGRKVIIERPREYVNKRPDTGGKTLRQVVTQCRIRAWLYFPTLEHSFTSSLIDFREKSNDFSALPHLP